MLCLLHHIPTEETIRYALGCAVPKPVDPQWLSKAQTAQQQVLQSSQPRFCWRVFPSAPLLEQLLTGQDIRSHLSGCTDCILLAATLSAQVDALIRRAQVRDMEQALWLDAAASAAIEEVCDTAQRQIAEQLGQSLTHRFSCGYGDLPLSIQPQGWEEKRACLRMEGVPRAYSLASMPSMVLLLPYLRQAYIHA